jgi:hypothetical protein
MSPASAPVRFVVTLKPSDRASPEIAKLNKRRRKVSVSIAGIRLRWWLVVGDQRIFFCLELCKSAHQDILGIDQVAEPLLHTPLTLNPSIVVTIGWNLDKQVLKNRRSLTQKLD